jgi:hypothetical protein
MDFEHHAVGGPAPGGDKLREECGVFGIRTPGGAAAPHVHLGL